MAVIFKYENLRLGDHDDSSTTEVEDTLMDDEKDTQNLRRTRCRTITCLSVLKEAHWFVDTILLLAIFGLLLRDKSQSCIPKTSEKEVGGDFTGVGPHCKYSRSKWTDSTLADNKIVSTQVHTFHINQTFAPYNTSEFFREEVLIAWDELLPRKRFPNTPLHIDTESDD